MPPKQNLSKRKVSERGGDSEESEAAQLLLALSQRRGDPVAITKNENPPRDIAKATLRIDDNQTGAAAERLLTKVGFSNAAEKHQFFENLSESALANIDDIASKISKVIPYIQSRMFLMEFQVNELVRYNLANIVEAAANTFTITALQNNGVDTSISIVKEHPDSLFAEAILNIFQTHDAFTRQLPSAKVSSLASDASKLQQDQDNAKRRK